METLEIFNQALSIIVPAAATLLATWFAILGAKLKAKYDEQIDNDIKKNVVNTTVAYVQQIFTDLNGEEKLLKAMDRANTILADKGIAISGTELRTLIESAVYGLKQGLTEEKTITIEAPEVIEDKEAE